MLGLNCRKSEKWDKIFLLKFQYLLNLWYSWRMCHLDLMGYKPHEQLKISEGKNLNQYSPIGAWLVIALDARVQSKFKWPNCKSYVPSLEHEGSMEHKSSLNRLRKFLPLESDAWKVIFHWDRMELYSDFLQKSQEDLYGNIRIETMFLVSLLTIWWSAHCCLLGQSQNSI